MCETLNDCVPRCRSVSSPVLYRAVHVNVNQVVTPKITWTTEGLYKAAV